MNILMTSKQNKLERAKEDLAIDQTRKCPSCDARIGLDIRKIKISSYGVDRPVRFSHYYMVKCGMCGCVWNTDEWFSY